MGKNRKQSGDREQEPEHDADGRITLAELFRGKTAAECRALYAGAFDWGPDVGREVIEK